MEKTTARVTYVTLATRDVPRLRDFYRALGFEEFESDGDEYISFRSAGAILALWDEERLSAEFRLPAGRSQEQPRAVLAMNVEEGPAVDRALDGARAAGARVVREAYDASFGGRSCCFADPEGNVWEIAWNPALTLDARGAPLV
jgi:catechol 2,3-dioxygenase-like lactoylglutathione lyase family enzyme